MPRGTSSTAMAVGPGHMDRRALLRAEDTVHRLDELRAIFADPAVEARFAAARAVGQLYRLTAGLVMHAAVVALQYVQVHWQDDYNLQAYCNQALAAAKQAVTATLWAHGSAAGVATLRAWCCSRPCGDGRGSRRPAGP